ncbi:MAG: GGDEF domain-containing protein, partial [Erysipelotrichaceae bacterium]
FSILMIDIDYFKSINDKFGHLIGDQHLIIVSQIMRNTCRSIDSIGRWGGEEFLIICPETDEEGATFLANKLLKAVQNYLFKPDQEITFSIGITHYQPFDTVDSLVLRADKALYLAKYNGRNRSQVFNVLFNPIVD